MKVEGWTGTTGVRSQETGNEPQRHKGTKKHGTIRVQFFVPSCLGGEKGEKVWLLNLLD